MLDNIRISLLHEAIQSPNLLADLAGLETYVAESYDARSFIELLQNADDAKSSRFYAEHFDNYLIVANDGSRFSDVDFESLCRSSASTKSRGESIGYRGIGFKSVVGVASRVHLMSGELRATFCRDKTKELISEATKVPLVRIPHEMELGNAPIIESKAQRLLEEGFTTLFIFEDLVSHAVATEFQSFDEASLLFLKNIREAQLIGAKSQKIGVTSIAAEPGFRHVSIKSNGAEQEWMIHSKNGVSISTAMKGSKAQSLPAEDAVVHAFLPTHERSGLGAKINGDFSTDPSRTKVVLDERSEKCTKQVASFLLDVIDGCIAKEDCNLLAPLIPNDDVRMAEFERPSFKKALFAELITQGKGRFSNLSIRPAWFESFHDFEKVAKASGLNVLPPDFEKVNGLSIFLRALGAKEARLNQLQGGLKNEELSANGAVEVAAKVAELESTKQLDVDIGDWKIWSNAGKRVSTNDLKNSPAPIENTTLLAEKVGGEKMLLRFLERTIGEKQTEVALPKESNNTPVETKPVDSSNFLADRISGFGLKDRVAGSEQQSVDAASSVTKWRSVEIQVMQYLQSQGWQVIDVSKRNVGYDLEGVSPDSEKFYFEVKSLSRVGEVFTLSTNEEVVARQHGKNYILALAHVTSAHFEIELIPDPANHLSFVRQCKQWAWVCENYPFNPQRIDYVDGQ